MQHSPILLKACWCYILRKFSVGKTLWCTFRLTLQSQFLFLVFSCSDRSKKKIGSNQVRRMQCVLEGFPYQLFKFLQDLFCNMPSFVVVVENDSFDLPKSSIFLKYKRSQIVKDTWDIDFRTLRNFFFCRNPRLKLSMRSRLSSSRQKVHPESDLSKPLSDRVTSWSTIQINLRNIFVALSNAYLFPKFIIWRECTSIHPPSFLGIHLSTKCQHLTKLNERWKGSI